MKTSYLRIVKKKNETIQRRIAKVHFSFFLNFKIFFSKLYRSLTQF